MNEIQTLARISNPYVLKFIEMLKSSRNYYFVYEFCNGGTLENVITEHGYKYNFIGVFWSRRKPFSTSSSC
jgi:serine/threonine-protein kinase ULK/ATG1